MCAVSGVLVLSLPIPIIAGNFEAFHKNQQKMTKAEKGKKKLKAAKIAEFERRQLYCNNKMTSCPSTRSKLPCCVVLTCYEVLARSLLVSRLPAHQPAQGGERQEHQTQHGGHLHVLLVWLDIIHQHSLVSISNIILELSLEIYNSFISSIL